MDGKPFAFVAVAGSDAGIPAAVAQTFAGYASKIGKSVGKTFIKLAL